MPQQFPPLLRPSGHFTIMKIVPDRAQKGNLEVPVHAAGVRQGLLKRLGLALRIAGRTIKFLGADGFNGADLPEGNFAAEKPLAETAMLLYVARRERSDPSVQGIFDKLVQDLIPCARSGRMVWDVLRYPSVYLQLATPHILLSALGRQDSQFDDLLARTEAASSSRGHEFGFDLFGATKFLGANSKKPHARRHWEIRSTF
jgi:hypothetical protein